MQYFFFVGIYFWDKTIKNNIFASIEFQEILQNLGEVGQVWYKQFTHTVGSPWDPQTPHRFLKTFNSTSQQPAGSMILYSEYF